MPNILDIRRRIRSVTNTRQITKAMKMVSAAKLRRAQERALAARPYAQMLTNVLKSLVSRAEIYDPETGQMLSGSYMDYALPRAADIPSLDITLEGVSTAANPLGVKGAGQAGAIASPQAVICAVLNALAPRGITHIDMPATSERIWRALTRLSAPSAWLRTPTSDSRRSQS